jgi:hypothetical protein
MQMLESESWLVQKQTAGQVTVEFVSGPTLHRHAQYHWCNCRRGRRVPRPALRLELPPEPVMTTGQDVRVPSGSVVTFRLSRPLDVGVVEDGLMSDRMHYHRYRQY